MFSGIIQEIGTIQSIRKEKEKISFRIHAPTTTPKLSIGSSVAIQGICSTVTEKKDDEFTINFIPETLKVTTADTWKKGLSVNLEPSLRLGDEISGHFVFGHIDEIGTVESIDKNNDEVVITIQTSPKLNKYLTAKGSITVNGVSLTVINTQNDQFTVALIPHTLEKTTIQYLKVNDKVNIEADMLAKYCVNYLENLKPIPRRYAYPNPNPNPIRRLRTYRDRRR